MRVFLKPKAAAAHLDISLPTLYQQVEAGRLPAPIYPAPRAPRWASDELDAALEATRRLPSEAKAERVARRLVGKASVEPCGTAEPAPASEHLASLVRKLA